MAWQKSDSAAEYLSKFDEHGEPITSGSPLNRLSENSTPVTAMASRTNMSNTDNGKKPVVCVL